MESVRKDSSIRRVLYCCAIFSCVAVALIFSARFNSIQVAAEKAGSKERAVPSATFNGANVGGIPDSLPTGRDVTFAVTGISGNVSNVEVSTTFGSPNHTWVGDIVAVLIAPNGASHTLFGRTGATTSTSFGDSSDLAGTYVFKDSAAAPPSGGWWQAATAAGAAVAVANGDYRTTNSGGAGATNPMPATSMNPSFTGVANANGTWTLRLSDNATGDTGSITAAVLTVDGGVGPTPTPDANVDFDGNGRTDFVVARGTTTPLAESAASAQLAPRRNVDDSTEVKGRLRSRSDSAIAPPIYWYTSFNPSGATGVGQLGDAATDFITPEDFDGDGKDDLAVWTEAAATQANFKILQSTTNTVRVEFFGQDGDDPAVVGDYDGDGKADPAVYRCPGALDPDGQCYYFFRGSLNNPGGNITYVPWGFGVDGDFFPYVGDLDGDGKHDFCIQRSHPSSPANGQFVLLRSGNLGVEYIAWGLASDFLIPGDYDGDGKTDITVRRSNTPTAGQRTYYTLYRTGATSQVQWGITGDSSVPGDYDGDGKTDFAIWRPSANDAQNFFWILNSSNLSVSTFEWGQCATLATCDFAVAGWAVH